MSDKLRVGLVGTGFGLRVHLPAYARSGAVEVVAICSARLDRARAIAEDWGVDWYTDDYRALVEREDVELVDVCPPPLIHKDVTLAALDAGKHVLCEKPFAVNVDEAEEMLAAAREAGVVHAVNHEMRYEPVRRYMRQLVLDGYIGTPRLINVVLHANHATTPTQEPYYYGWVNFIKDAGGFVMASLSHHLDLTQFTFGTIENVVARPKTYINEHPVLTFEYRDGDPIGPETPTLGTKKTDAEDTVAIIGSIGDALLSVTGSWALYHPSGLRVYAYGDQGTLCLDLGGRLLGGRRDDAELTELSVPSRYDLDPSDGAHYLVPHFSQLARDLRAAVRGEEVEDPVMATFEDGLALQRVLDASRAHLPKGDA